MALESTSAHLDDTRSMVARLVFDLMLWQNLAHQENDQPDSQIVLVSRMTEKKWKKKEKHHSENLLNLLMTKNQSMLMTDLPMHGQYAR